MSVGFMDGFWGLGVVVRNCNGNLLWRLPNEFELLVLLRTIILVDLCKLSSCNFLVLSRFF
ncbi:hypothetical protein GBA52_009939 [Prunus armeniaca]|nr:hypothetical protein GBA52_009939 [Prunus armeniaca]